MELLNREECFFDRNESGDLLPVRIALKSLEKKNKEAPCIEVLPISRGKWIELLTLKQEEQDVKILLEHVVNPKFGENDYKCMKPLIVSAIITAITALTLDVDIDELKGKSSSKVTEAEEFALKKE